MRKALYIYRYIHLFQSYFQANTVAMLTPTTTTTRGRSIIEDGQTNKGNCIKEPKLFVAMITASLLFGYVWIFEDKESS